MQLLRDLVVLAIAPDREELVEASEEEIRELRGKYDPNAIIEGDADLSRVMQLIESGHFNRFRR